MWMLLVTVYIHPRALHLDVKREAPDILPLVLNLRVGMQVLYVLRNVSFDAVQIPQHPTMTLSSQW